MTPPQPRRVLARDPLEQTIARCVRDVLGRDVAALDDPLFPAGEGALHAPALAPALASALDAACDVALTATQVLAAGTVRELGWLMRDQGRALWAQRWRRFAANPDATPLFYVHGDPNGGGSYCKALAAALGPDIALHALNPHGPFGPAPLADIPTMAAFHIQTLRAIQPRGPYRLGGFCLGGIVAFEMARQLTAAGDEVAGLVMIGPTMWSRYFGLRRACARLARVLRLAPRREERLFFVLRNTVQHWFARLDRWRARRNGHNPRLLPRTPRLRDWPADCLNTLRGRHHRVSHERRRVHARPADARERARVEFWNDVLRTVRAAVLQRWPGRAVILWPAQERQFRFGDPQATWAPLLGTLEVRSIPGTHTGCLVWEVDAVAAAIRRALG